MRNLTAVILLLLVTTLFGSCSQQGNVTDLRLPSGYSDFRELPATGWCYDDTLTFVTPAATGEMRVAIRHGSHYPYRNLWLEVSLTAPGAGAPSQRDTVELELADPFGLWRGTGVGPTRQCEAVVVPRIRVDSGTVVELRHIMRLDTLPAVNQAGIFILD